MFWRRFAVFLMLAASPVQAASLTVAEARGKRIYTQGTGASGKEIQAALGDNGAEVSAAVLSCAKCHGREGRGREESGVIPSDIRREILTKPYTVNVSGGRSRAPYDEARLIRAISLGIDSSGHDLARTMPRFRLSREDAADLLAYLKRLGDTTDPGVEDGRIRIGMLLPPEAQFPVAHAIQSATQAFFDRLNQAGGIHGRKIDLRIAAAPKTTAEWVRVTEEQNVIALVNTWIAGVEQEAEAFIAKSEIPVIGPFTLYPPVALPLNPYIFYLEGGLPGEVDSLAAYVETQTVRPRKVSIVSSDEEPWHSTAVNLIQKHPQVEWTQSSGSPFTLALLPAPAADAFYKGVARAKSLDTLLLIPAAMTTPESFDLLKHHPRVIFALPGSPDSATPSTAAEYRSLAVAYHLPPDHIAAQWTALAACRILQEGLSRQGREVSREGLVESLEKLYHFDTGFSVPISYGPNQRIGDSEAHLVRYDAAAGQLRPVR